MMCPACYGRSFQPSRNDDAPQRCLTCSGMGTISCCDGPAGCDLDIGNNPETSIERKRAKS